MLTEDEKNLFTEIIFSGFLTDGNPPTAEYLISTRQKTDDEVRAILDNYRTVTLAEIDQGIINTQRTLDWLNQRKEALE